VVSPEESLRRPPSARSIAGRLADPGHWLDERDRVEDSSAQDRNADVR
jgi:hypothetical protein